MSENSSDSESSCGWTIINNEGSDIETLNSEHEPSSDLVADEHPVLREDVEDQQDKPLQLQDDTQQASESTASFLDAVKFAPETEEEPSPDDSLCPGAPSDDSDIATLEAPKVEEIGAEQDAVAVEEEAEDSEDLNLGSSSSSQYTFSQPETVFPSRQTTDESSNDEVSDSSGPTPRKRRAKRRTVSCSESEVRALPVEVVHLQKAPSAKLSSSLNGCIILALVIAVSMGFGHFYDVLQGTIQIREHQKYVEKIHADELNDVKDDLYQCKKEQETSVGQKLEAEDHVTCSEVHDTEKLPFEAQKKNFDAENLQVRESAGNGEKVVDSLGEELTALLKHSRTLEERGTDIESFITENQKLKQQLEGEQLLIHTVVRQKDTLLAETELLRSELDKERESIKALREELNDYTQSSINTDSENKVQEEQEIENMQERLKELEKKLTFEQQRSDLWERLYIEAREYGERKENPKTKEKNSKHSFFGSVKDTFDAMKNSTKEFVRHHKEKIKQAKQAVKEKLKKFSDSVKLTFRHFKDSTKVMFDGNRNKKKSGNNREETKNAKTDFGDYQDPRPADYSKTADKKAETTQTHFTDSKPFKTFENHKKSRKSSNGHECDKNQHTHTQGCSGVFECAHQESMRIFNKVLEPVKADEFTYMMKRYLQEEVVDFHHWKELEKFINRFFHNGVFIHDRMLFTDFVNDLEHYLGDLKEYKMASIGTFEDLDKFVYSYFFGDSYSAPYGPSASRCSQHSKDY